MSTRYNNGSHYENHQRAAELQNGAAHAHRAAEQQHEKQDHPTDRELSRMEINEDANFGDGPGSGSVGHGIAAFGHGDIAALAYEYWQDRGCPEGSSADDWSRAVKELRSRAITGAAPHASTERRNDQLGS